ncbi:MaoC family dehydratase [Halosolutus amylolyticus]|uniref:MaoC family dehydratase n=1 Tax=Halosolutus amylolyticus TaxID=2932267 RepID=A0ABD5PTF3_9EURY|nr:MaoC family dehydratase [Halosolutus amylolyticus]
MSSQSPQSTDVDSTAINEHWANISRHVVNSYVEANNAVLAAMGISPATSGAEDDEPDAPVTEESVSVPSVACSDETWTTDRSVSAVSDLEVGDFVQFSKPIAETDVSAFAGVSGDTNRLHLDEDYADATQFQGRIVHGTLVAGTISAALARFPGNTIYLSQDLEFRAPVAVGDTVTADCRIVEALGNDQYRLETTVSTDEGETVIDGEAVVVITESPDAE